MGREGWLDSERFYVNAAIVDERDMSGRVFPLLDVNRVKSELSNVVTSYRNVDIGCHQSNNGDSVLFSLIAEQPFGLRSAYCAASSGMYIFLPDGTVSSCWESLGKDCGRIGGYSEEGLSIDRDRAAHRFGRSVGLIETCLDCRYCLVCAGGCSQYAEINTGDIYQPYCGDFKESYSWVLAEAVEKFLQINNL